MRPASAGGNRRGGKPSDNVPASGNRIWLIGLTPRMYILCMTTTIRTWQMAPWFHGVHDAFENSGFMTLGTSRETSAFICDAIALAWEQHYRHRFPDANELCLTFDAGGTNSIRSTRFKEDLIDLSKRLGIPSTL